MTPAPDHCAKPETLKRGIGATATSASRTQVIQAVFDETRNAPDEDERLNTSDDLVPCDVVAVTSTHTGAARDIATPVNVSVHLLNPSHAGRAPPPTKSAE